MPIRSLVAWIRSRTVQLLALAESIIAVLIGFDVLDWTAEQTATVMAVVAAVLAVVVGQDVARDRQALDLHDLQRNRFTS